MTVPNINQDLYGRAVQTAIAILALSRSDLIPADQVTSNTPTPTDPTYTAHGLETHAVEILHSMGIANPEEYFSSRGTSPRSFTDDLNRKIVAQPDRYLATQGQLPPAILASLQGTLHDLVNWKWSDSAVSQVSGNTALQQTILGSLSQVDESRSVVARNRYCTRFYWSGHPVTQASMLTDLTTKWNAGTFGVQHNPTSVDSAPVIGPSDGAQPSYWYARDLIPQTLYNKAVQVLAVTSNQSALQRSRQGSWRTVRVFSSRSPTGTMLTVLNKVEGFLNTSLAGLQNVADGILRVIAFLEQRIREVQELIKRIESYLDIPFQISFPSAKVLLLITNGTSGVVSGLTGATNKPTEGRESYAGGGVIVAGSAPAILIELLSAGISAAGG